MIRPESKGQCPRLSIVVSHPTQFEGPLYPKIARKGHLQLEVFFWQTAQPTLYLKHTETGIKPQWDNIPLTEGYSYQVIPSQPLACWRFIHEKLMVRRDHHVVLINGWSGKAALFTLIAALRTRVPVILRQDTVDLYRTSALKSIRRWATRSVLYRLPTAFMATGSLARQHLLRRGIKEEAIFTLPYAVDNEFLCQAVDLHRTRRAELRRALGIDPDATVIMTALQFIPREGVGDLVRAYSGLSDWHDSTVLLLAGDGPLRSEVEAFVRQQGTMRVVFTRWVPYSRLIELYAISDLFVHPGVREPWGCSVQEAAACRLPIVASDLVGASHDLVRPGVNGLVYQGGNVDSLRTALMAMLAKREQWPAMGEQSWLIAQDWGHERAIMEIERAVDYALSLKRTLLR